jgi:hypothetical protein
MHLRQVVVYWTCNDALLDQFSTLFINLTIKVTYKIRGQILFCYLGDVPRNNLMLQAGMEMFQVIFMWCAKCLLGRNDDCWLKSI